MCSAAAAAALLVATDDEALDLVARDACSVGRQRGDLRSHRGLPDSGRTTDDDDELSHGSYAKSWVR